MKLAGLTILFAVLCGGASATQYYNVSVTGTLLTRGVGPSDPVLSVGDKVTLTARFSDKYVVDWGDTGYQIAGAWGGQGLLTQTVLPKVGEEFWRIDAGVYSWSAAADILDGSSIFFEHYSDEAGGIVRTLAGPLIVMKDGKVVGLGSSLMVGSTSPVIDIGDSGGVGQITDLIFGGPPQYIETFSPLHFDNQFTIQAANGIYGNWIYSPGFTGVWDFESSRAAIPEPATWGLLLIGFGSLGAALRRKRRPCSPA